MSHKSEVPISEHDDGDHSQPINLAAPRAPAPPATFAANPNLATSVATQPVTLRAHTESQKPGLMLQALYIRPSTSARPPGPGHVMTQIMGNQVSTSPHFSTKPMFKGVKGVKVNYFSEKQNDKPGGQEFKNANIAQWTVIRVPTADNQSQGNTTSQGGSSSMASNILPNALAGNSSRHMVSAAVHPVLSGGASNSGPMASIIKGSQQVSHVGHVLHPPYSSHVPRGPAAVASITSAPKSAVATPILRAPHSSGAMTLASSVISPHAASSLRTRSPTMVTGRTATPPVVSTIGHQVVDLQKNSSSHCLQTQSQVGLVSRSMDSITSSSMMRPGSSSHLSPLAVSKPISISQPIVQHLQQVSEKGGYLKTISSSSLSHTSANSTPAHQNSSHHSSSCSSSSESHGVVPTITRATLSNISGSSGYAAGIVQLSTASSVPTLRPSLVQPHPLHALTSSSTLVPSQSTPHQTLTVISAKPLQSAAPPITPSSSLNRASVCSTGSVSSSASASTTASVLPSTHSRLLSIPSSTGQSSSIPVAKVYPQSLPTTSKSESANMENSRMAALTTSGNSSAMSTSTSSVATTSSAAVVVTDKRSDSTGPVRVSSLTKHSGGSSSYSSVSSATYLYDQYQGTAMAVRPYVLPPSNQNYTSGNLSNNSQMRPLSLSHHGSSGLHPSVCVSGSSAAPAQPLNSLMVAVDSRHITLHQPYNAMSSGKSNSEMTSHQTTANISNVSSGLVIMSQASSAHNSAAGQQQGGGGGGSVSNHLSPRPSILRKRTSEAISSMTKRNLIPSLCATESLSPRPEFKSMTTTLSSPKPLNESLQENGLATTALEPEIRRLLIASSPPPVRMEPGAYDKSYLKDPPVEASPRKKPRKQLLSANELMETHSSDADAEESFEQEPTHSVREIKTEDDEDVKWVTFSKRPTMSLLGSNRHPWKSRQNHFMKYTDVKPKEEKKSTAHELANQKGVMNDVNAWKIYHLTGQMDDLSNAEEATVQRMSCWLEFEEKGSWRQNHTNLNNEDYKILSKLTDIVKGNLQRSKIAQEQAMEAKQQILKITEHKPNIIEIINKYVSRRPVKKKEKT